MDSETNHFFIANPERIEHIIFNVLPNLVWGVQPRMVAASLIPNMSWLHIVVDSLSVNTKMLFNTF